MSYPNDVLEQIDTKLDELEELIQKLPLKPAIKANIVNQIYDMWTEIEEFIDVTPTDF